ncbi:MAG TPA: ROK family protein [Actinomycetes bacterium]
MSPPAGSGRRPVLAVDIGGTKMAAALVDPGGRVLESARVGTPIGPRADARALWRTVTGLVRSLVGDDVKVSGVGVGCGGPMTWPAAEVSPLNIPGWRGFPLRERLRELFPRVPVRVHNDAVCLAVGEHWRGAGRGAPNLLGMVVSTGVGGGLVLGGRLIDGASGNAGHVGHVVVDPAGPDCICGGKGCLEAFASGPRLAAWARAQGWAGATGDTARELAVDAGRGHEVATRAMERAGSALGIAIASATHLCDLDVVTVGGGLSQAGSLLFDPLERAFRRHARMGFARGVRDVPARLGQEAGLVGAAALVLSGDRYWSAD